MSNNNIIEELSWRKITNNISNSERVINAQNNNKGIYCGFDPTSDSLHLGNLMQILLLRRFALFGFQPIAVIGGATAMIGDPSGKSQERNLLDKTELEKNISLISKQLNQLINKEDLKNESVTEVIKGYNFLSASDLQLLNSFLIEKTNSNTKNDNAVALIIAKLPLPLEELLLLKTDFENLYKVLELNQEIIALKQKILELNFKEIRNYLEIWKAVWSIFVMQTWGKSHVKNVKEIKILNNKSWLDNFSMLSWLRDVGKHFNLNQMIRKETVATRLDSGISYTEFSYMVLQAYDFYYLYNKESCYLQSGGSDQWGNITAGLELIRKLVPNESQAAGITINLLTNANGAKFGKTEKGALYLSTNRTSTFDFYQFLLQQEDTDLEMLFNGLTFLTANQIKFVLKLHNINRKNRVAQKLLAAYITAFVHQVKGYWQAVKITTALFYNQITDLRGEELIKLFKEAPHYTLFNNESISNVIMKHKICNSMRELRELIANQAINVNGNKITNENFIIKKENAIDNQVSLIKKGKKNYYLLFHNY